MRTVSDVPATPGSPATRAATELGLAHEVRTIERARSAEEAAERLGVAPDRLLKTLVVRRGEGDHLLVLVPGPARIDWPRLRAHLGVSRLSLPDAEEAREVTGYERGTITPLGSRTALQVIMPDDLAGTGPVAVGAGAHGVFVVADADELAAALGAELAAVTEHG
jgi:Cys-tRNA(Pro)/Cys-tRNA(Cys) deacylase